jgi:predicted nucleotidyltransferase
VTLHEALAPRVSQWREGGYTHDVYPAIGEILEWARGDEASGNVRFLRPPQLLALETYWYLRLVEGTPHVLDLYRRCFRTSSEFLAALGLDHSDLKTMALDLGVDGLLDAIRTDDGLVKKYKLDAVRETLILDYPSYILALAMGAGKTLLIGAIVATEFAMAAEYPGERFVHNALVFAPGKTPIESLRELVSAPYQSILPPRLHALFVASVKFTFTRDGDPDIPVIDRSLFNVVVTNTEKIRIQKEAILKSSLGTLFSEAKADDARQDIANRRLTKIATLPNLAVFSDEAHHTYGQSLSTELKKVRKTVDYLHAQTDLISVINTTGTPYFQRQPLRDVVIWYGLSQGIRDNILKDVSGNIHEFEFGGDTAAYLQQVVADFFRDYGMVALPNGALAKLAIYFPQTDDLEEYRPAIDAALARVGVSPALVLVNTSDAGQTKASDVDAFNRLNDPAAPHRVILLVNKGTEGWNCPSLFACALARKLKAANNFVLQAASRCLRQVPGNTAKARIYLSRENHGVLDQQLRETYGEDIATLNQTRQERRSARVVLRKVPVAPLVVRHKVTSVVRAWEDAGAPVALERPKTTKTTVASRIAFSLSDRTTRVLQQVDDAVTIDIVPPAVDIFTAASEFARRYRLEALPLNRELRKLYPDGDVPAAHLDALASQIESQTRTYEIFEEYVERAIAIVKENAFHLDIGPQGEKVYTTEITYPVDRERNLIRWEDFTRDNARDVGFHYTPIEFDSQPERSFFEQVLRRVNVEPWEVEDMYFTGGLTDPNKTDFFIEYRDCDGRPRRYTPDFIIRKKPSPGQKRGSGRVLIVEIKREKDREDPTDGAIGLKARAARAWEGLNPDRIKYEMIFTATDSIGYGQLAPVWDFARATEVTLPVPVDKAGLEAFCRKWQIAQLEVFGSALREDFGPESDLDFLVSFAKEAPPLGLEFFRMKRELRDMVGREIDLLTRRTIEQSKNWIRRRSILSSARSIYGG